MLQFIQFLREEHSQPEDALTHHGWKLSDKGRGSSSHYSNKNYPGHEIQVNHGSGDWHHWNSEHDNAVAAGFTGHELHAHLSKFHGLKEEKKSKCPKCGSSQYGLMPTDFETAKCSECGSTWDTTAPKPPEGQKYLRIKDVREYGRKHLQRLHARTGKLNNEDYGDPADFRTTTKLWSSYNPIAQHDYGDKDNDKMDFASIQHKVPTPNLQVTRDGVMQEKTTTPNDNTRDDYGPGATPSYARMSEGFADPSDHPLHATASRLGFTHTGSSSALGAATHVYSHPNSKTDLHLKTSSGGAASWKHGEKSGSDSQSLSNHTNFNMRESHDRTKHELHGTLMRLGYDMASSHTKAGSPTNHLYVHRAKSLPHVTLHQGVTNNEFTVHSKTDTPGQGKADLEKHIATHMMQDEGFLDFLKKPSSGPAFKKSDSLSPEYKTNHSYNTGDDIDPKTVPVFKPSYDYSKKTTEETKPDLGHCRYCGKNPCKCKK